MNILILEDNDERVKQFRKNIAPRHAIIHTDEAKKTIEYLKKTKFDILFLDHDLGNEIYVDTKDINTGSEVARWLNKHPEQMPGQVVLHSLNEYGRKNMKALLPEAINYPFAWEKIKLK